LGATIWHLMPNYWVCSWFFWQKFARESKTFGDVYHGILYHGGLLEDL